MQAEDYSKRQPIVEVYPCLQSEGKYTGIPHILIRTTGCVMRCQFSNTDFCDSHYTSWSPEKGVFNLNDIISIYKKYPQIRYTMISGGSPTMHEELLKKLCEIAKSFDHFITIETEGSKAVGTVADFISLSPKFTNSIPKLGTKQPNGKDVTESHIKKHEKFRTNYDEMLKMIEMHADFQIKPVISNEKDLDELNYLLNILEIERDKVYLMPAGGTAKELEDKRAWLMELAWQEGYNYTDRIHIVCYGTKRGV